LIRLAPERIIWLGGWLATVVAALWVRGLLPIDETRYVGVAWEMWERGDLLVPYLNGEPYSHKPPFLFWMINFGWWLFGVNEWWPRMLSSLFSLASLFLLVRFARLLRPGQTAVHELAPLILFSSLLWTLFSTATMFDIMLAFWVLLAVLGVVQAAHKVGWISWWLTGLALGMGMLSKGPVILLHVLPLALLAPFWVHKAVDWKRWYSGLALAILIGVAIILAWAIPAGLAGGDKYIHDIFWGQTANRMVQSFAHRREWWWYIPLLPIALFPWLFWTPALRRLAANASPEGYQSGRLLLIWTLPVFIAFSLISGKQPHYLLPLFPAVDLWLAMSSHDAGVKIKGSGHWLTALVYALIAAVLFIAPIISRSRPLPDWVGQLSQWPAAIILLLALASLLPWAPCSLRVRARVVALSSIVFTLVLLFSVFKILYMPAYDLHEISSRISVLQTNGHTVAVPGKYHNQFQFFGRLKNPIVIIDWPDIQDWLRDKKQAYLVVVRKKRYELHFKDDEFTQPYRGKWMALLRRSTLRENPELAYP